MNEHGYSYRIRIEGNCDPAVLSSILESVKQATSVDGRFTIEYGVIDS